MAGAGARADVAGAGTVTCLWDGRMALWGAAHCTRTEPAEHLTCGLPHATPSPSVYDSPTPHLARRRVRGSRVEQLLECHLHATPPGQPHAAEAAAAQLPHLRRSSTSRASREVTIREGQSGAAACSEGPKEQGPGIANATPWQDTRYHKARDGPRGKIGPLCGTARPASRPFTFCRYSTRARTLPCTPPPHRRLAAQHIPASRRAESTRSPSPSRPQRLPLCLTHPAMAMEPTPHPPHIPYRFRLSHLPALRYFGYFG